MTQEQHAQGNRADLDKKPADVASMFDEVAARYDLTNDVLSFGQTRLWRRRLVEALDVRPGERVLDLAAGTGTSTEPFVAAGAEAIACDFSLGMLQVGKRRRPDMTFVAGDAMDLPFADDTFDAVTISFGLRNVAEPLAGLAEMLRVTRPGGRLAVMEFSDPTFRPFNRVYNEYLMRALPSVARAVSSNPEAYVYLAESIRAWPDQEELAAQITGVGYSDVKYRNLSGGIVAIHHARKLGRLDSDD
ncbi:demethylmenaquinone methyltransferase/2-methoxy-6-polyprenyl-1,4-benzoquinol methylase [Nesterenkonia xinjiangensis]|uniref:Demethylmenaquinone methyltransferase n=2 Tax=Nesterenkonia xinjiangensis TaxID=225327 RepID=A0A7Z0GKM9_9MICC|nr:demethylmenaquinone methyltransferase/2-methoxy-6-polyprenyl-1,4-benzoquinol methylase [Nesterenkonia xinjiangensis]